MVAMDTNGGSDALQGPDLVRSAQAGNRQAQGELFRRYEGLVLATALRRVRHYDEAQELVQEVFVQVLQKLHQLRSPECFGSWLRSITVRLVINRAQRRDPAVSTEPQALATTCVDRRTPDADAVAAERASHVSEGLTRLRDMDRDTLVAFYLRGLSLLQMSDDFDAPVGTIKRRLHVARQRLAREIDHLGVA
jgi:RNA polymerase sigma-70 factor (ECF subfamily)